MYHNIGSPPEGARLRSLYVRERAFAGQMALLSLLGVKGLSMSAAMPYLKSEKTGRIAVITFDDGYLDTLEAALPILRRYGFSATCYAVSSLDQQHNYWDAENLGVKKPLMSTLQLKQWLDAGMELGAHSRTHPFLTQCSDDELVSEILGCKDDLEQLVDSPVTQFCYPSGDVDDRVAQAVRQAGYVAATTTRRGRASAGSDLFRLPRVLVARHNPLYLFPIKLFTSYEDRRG
jgi:peptidoglycan/xylan/chitin deacetylase (PgdA/CDA1 family)